MYYVVGACAYQSSFLLTLSNLEPFRTGRQRFCYIHPDYPNRLVKVDQLNLRKPVTKKEVQYLWSIKKSGPCLKLKSIAQFYGTVETDIGVGAIYELIVDGPNNKPAATLLDFIKDNQTSHIVDVLTPALEAFRERVYSDGIIIRDLNADNICIRTMPDGSLNLVAVDGFGHKYPFPQSQIYLSSKRAANWKMNALFKRFHYTNVEALIAQPTQRNENKIEKRSIS